jgi:putative two-component system protein, hydrogenase maturation factor HypX/HoxX
MEIASHFENGVYHLYFSVSNGAMDLIHCQALLNEYQNAIGDPNSQVIILWGGKDFFSNGIDLNSIHKQYNPTILAYKNLKAINKLVFAILNTDNKMTIAGIRGPAAAGGVMLALACDLRYARRSTVFNPSYVNMGLSGSEYWSILLPSMIGFGKTQKLVYEGTPISAKQALDFGMIHHEGCVDYNDFEKEITLKAEFLANTNIKARLATKAVLNKRLMQDVHEQVLFELQQMKDCCNNTEFTEARTDFTQKRKSKVNRQFLSVHTEYLKHNQ